MRAQWPLRRLVVVCPVQLHACRPARHLTLGDGSLALQNLEEEGQALALRGDEACSLASLQLRRDEVARLGEVLVWVAGHAATGGSRDGAGEEVVEVGAGVTGGCPARGRDAKPGKQRLGVGLRSRGRGSGGFGLAWRQAENVRLDELNGALEVSDASGLEAVVGFRDEFFDLGFVVLEEWVDVGLVDDAGALGLGEDEVEEEEKADVGVEGNPSGVSRRNCRGEGSCDIPDENPFSPGLDEERAGEDDPVHEPWRQLGGVGGLECLVRGEEWEEEGCDGTAARRRQVSE